MKTGIADILSSLILLLLCCDAWKSVWYLVYPAVVFAGWEITSEDAFCQVQGFFLQMSLEASGMKLGTTVL